MKNTCIKLAILHNPHIVNVALRLSLFLPTDLQLNAVSLVNLAMSLGIAVEFCAHVLHAYCATPTTMPRAHRAEAALNARCVD